MFVLRWMDGCMHACMPWIEYIISDLNLVAHKVITDILTFNLNNLIGLRTNNTLLHPRPVAQLFIRCVFGNLQTTPAHSRLLPVRQKNMFVIFLAPFCASVCQRQVASIP